jgi:glucokinase
MFLGVEIGGTKLQIGVCDRQGRVKALERRSVQRRGGRAGILEQLEEIIPALLGRELEGRASSLPLPARGHDRAWPSRVEAIGIGFGGPVDAERGRVVKSHQVAGWTGFELRRWLERRYRLPTVVENDANAAAFAEAVCGAGGGRRSVLYITVGTGIGAGFVLDGQIYNGRFGAMELGHTSVCLEFHDFEERSSPKIVKLRTVESLASGLAIERGVSTVEQAARYLGVALANAITLLNPEIVVIGGGVSLAGDKFLRPLRATVRRLAFVPFRQNFQIVPAALGESVVVVGAALLAARRS